MIDNEARSPFLSYAAVGLKSVADETDGLGELVGSVVLAIGEIVGSVVLVVFA